MHLWRFWGEGCCRKRKLAEELHEFENLRKRAELEAQEHESEGSITYFYKYINLKCLKVSLDRNYIILQIYGELWTITRGLEHSIPSKLPQNEKERCGI
jgi:hypothetical protein